MQSTEIGPVVVVTVGGDGGRIHIKGIPYSTITSQDDIYQTISEHIHTIVEQYRKPVVVIAHSPEGRHCLIYKTDRTIEEVSSKELTRWGIDPDQHPPVATRTFLDHPETPNIDSEARDVSAVNGMEESSASLPITPMEPKTPLAAMAGEVQNRTWQRVAVMSAAVVMLIAGITTAIVSRGYTDPEDPVHTIQIDHSQSTPTP